MADPHLEQLALTILAEGYLISLGVVDEQGVWVADVIYTYDDNFNIYWMSKPNRRHSLAIDEQHSPVAGTITLTTGPDDPDKGLQLAGIASRVGEIPVSSTIRFRRKRHKPETGSDEELLGEHKWYKLVPSQIELIYGPEFGYSRQKVR